MKTLKILHLEDSVFDAELIALAVKNAGINCDIILAESREAFEAALDALTPDVILSDHMLYQFNSLHALEIYKERKLDMPFILVTGTVSEEFAVRILQEGAADYILKDNLARLGSAILNAVEKCRLRKEQQQYINQIIANEALLKEAEHLARFGSWHIDLRKGNMKCSDELFRICGYEPGEITPEVAGFFLKHIHPEDADRIIHELKLLLEKKETYESECRIVDKSGLQKHISFKVTVSRESGKAVSLMGISKDITKQKEAEEKVLKNIQELANLEKQLVTQKLRQQRIVTETTIQAQEKERNELGKELHDNINQILASVKLFLEIAIKDKTVRDEVLVTSKKNLETAIAEIRKLSHSLVPPSLGDHGLVDAINDLVNELNLLGHFKTYFAMDDFDESHLDDTKKLMVYRILQEQVNNVVKYARAASLQIELYTRDEKLYLRVTDDGVGFDKEKKAKGIGLRNIEQRVLYYSGGMDLQTAPGKGTSLEVWLPVNQE